MSANDCWCHKHACSPEQDRMLRLNHRGRDTSSMCLVRHHEWLEGSNEILTTRIITTPSDYNCLESNLEKQSSMSSSCFSAIVRIKLAKQTYLQNSYNRWYTLTRKSSQGGTLGKEAQWHFGYKSCSTSRILNTSLGNGQWLSFTCIAKRFVK